MYADVALSEDTTTLYVRWEIQYGAGERKTLERLGGPVTLVIDASHHEDVGGTYHERAEVEVLVYPHPGVRNRGQAKFRDHEARRRFVENLQGGIVGEVADFLDSAAPGSVSLDGAVIRRTEWPAPAPTAVNASPSSPTGA
jgi:hypothetical protein